ncbi:MAG: YidC/Oxa1 family membrane protein insertase [Lachnospiraceae bacterium]|nr:YidC/Oxa1 family membrane protein insertase [Lachnospiraceae bacterium]
MNLVVLTQVGGWLKWPAWIFGQVFEWLYELLSLIGIENVAVTVVLFTIVTKLLMTPLTIKQQKFSRLSNKMNPELTAIQEKYKGKKDEKSMRLQQLETQAVYEKYGTSPTSGCLPMLITLPIMFALYRVIYAIPAYVDDIYALYNAIAEGLKSLDYFPYMSEVATSLGVATKDFAEMSESVLTNDHLIDIMTKFGTKDWTALAEQFPSIEAIIAENVTQINAIHSVGKFNILDKPWDYKWSLALLIPVLATVTQLISSKLSMAGQKKRDNSDNPMAQSMNSMMYTMPFMSGIMCFMFPICIGIYWVASTVVTTVYQIIINKHIDKMDIDEMIAKNVEKQNKKKEKYGIEYGSKMAELAKTQTKSIDAEAAYKKEKTASSYANATGKDYSSEDSDTPKPSVETKSIAGYANMLKRD